MADGQGGYPQQPLAGQDPHSPLQSTDGVQPAVAEHPEVRPGRKKGGRSYAAGAFDVGAGGNAALAGGQPPGPAYPAQQPAAPQYGGYPQQPQAQGYGQQPYPKQAHSDIAPHTGGTPQLHGYGNQGGYAAPIYPAPGGVDEKFGAMSLGDQPQRQGAPLQLNRLQTSDLISQPFHISEINQPPPPIVLPPNVSHT